MIAALFALAAAMIIGGAAAVVQGFPYVRLESGLAMVIAGSVAASSGAVLFGLGVVAAGLRRVERAAARGVPIPAGGASDGASAPPSAAPDGRPRLPPVLPAGREIGVAPTVEPPLSDPGPERAHGEAGLAVAGRAAAEPELPIPGLAPPPHEPGPAPEPEPGPAEPAIAEPAIAEPPHAEPVHAEDDLFAAPEDRPHGGDQPALRRSLDALPEPVAQAPRAVVGRYASGGNTYVMFEDGAIEAETPQGRFTFTSLDELKAFVDGGGEAGTRGAA